MSGPSGRTTMGSEHFSYELELCDPANAAGVLRQHVDQVIEDGTFGWALGHNRPIAPACKPGGNSWRQRLGWNTKSGHRMR